MNKFDIVVTEECLNAEEGYIEIIWKTEELKNKVPPKIWTDLVEEVLLCYEDECMEEDDFDGLSNVCEVFIEETDSGILYSLIDCQGDVIKEYMDILNESFVYQDFFKK